MGRRRSRSFFVRLLLPGCVLAWYAAVALAAGNPAEGSRTQQMTLQSSSTGHDYLIQIALPEAPPPPEGYPVLYVLDGNAYWPLMRAARAALTRDTPSTPARSLLIVGVGYRGVERFAVNARAQDYTSTAPHTPDSGNGRSYGGAGNFLQFIEQQLKPAIAARYDVNDTAQSILGHSLGGLFVLHVLFTRPDTFANYLAIAPSIWWNDRYILRELAAFAERNEAPQAAAGVAGSCVLIGAGALAQTPRPEERGTLQAKQLKARNMVDNARMLAWRLRQLRPDMTTQFVTFPGARHGTVMRPAAPRVLKFLDRCGSAVQ